MLFIRPWQALGTLGSHRAVWWHLACVVYSLTSSGATDATLRERHFLTSWLLTRRHRSGRSHCSRVSSLRSHSSRCSSSSDHSCSSHGSWGSSHGKRGVPENARRDAGRHSPYAQCCDSRHRHEHHRRGSRRRNGHSFPGASKPALTFSSAASAFSAISDTLTPVPVAAFTLADAAT